MATGQTPFESIPTPTINGLAAGVGHAALTEPSEALASSREFEIDDVQYNVTHAVHGERHDMGLAVTTVDSAGVERNIGIYRSQSEGGWRAMFGRKPGGVGTYIKFSVRDLYYQYTQDNQLHPSVAATLQPLLENPAAAGASTTSFDVPNDWPTIDAVMQDFAAQRQTYRFDNPQLSELLLRRSPDRLDTSSIEGDLKYDGIAGYVADLNSALEAANEIPDFSEPSATAHDTHPILGAVTREVFTHNDYEWHMVYDGKGQVWIDRLRYANSKATPYGTDAEMIYSGILTLKPYDYLKQVSGLYQFTGAPQGHYGQLYHNITKFIDTFAPVQRFREQRGVQRLV